jgi:hypothetical protein
MTRLCVNTVLALLVATSAAYAQRPPARPSSQAPKPTATSTKLRGYISIDGGYQAATEDFSNGGTFTQYLEQANFDSDYEVKPGPQFNVGGGIRLWRGLHAGVAVTRFTRSTPVRVTGAIPHPFFFSRPRSIEGDVTSLKRQETAVHLQARAVFAATPRIQVALFGGPSMFNVNQGVVGGVQFSESYPFDTAAFQSATTSVEKKSQVGFNAGGDVAFFFTRHIGVGGSAQFSRAEVTLPGGNATDVTTNAGGIQAGAGIRLRF